MNIEALRVLMMFLIVCLHIGTRIVDFSELHDVGGLKHALIHGFRSVTFLGVSTFAFISGYYGIQLKVNKIFHMECMALTYGIIIIIGNLLVGNPLKYHAITGMLFPASSCYLWYYSSYIQLMLISPLLNLSFKYIEKDKFQYSVIGVILIVFVGRLLSVSESCTLFTLIAIYVIGQYIKRFPIKMLEQKALSLFLFLQSLQIVIFFLLGYVGLGKILYLLEGNNNPVTFLSAILLFFIFKNMKVKSNIILCIAKLAPYMLAVYVLSEGSMISGLVIFQNVNIPFIMVLPSAFAVLLLCSGIEWGRKKLFFRVEGYIYNVMKSRLESLQPQM